MTNSGLPLRILVVTRNFPPLWGGMELLNFHLLRELERRSTVRLIAPRGSRDHTSAAVGVQEVPLRPLTRFLFCAFLHARAVAREWRPDVIHAGSGLTAPVALVVARLFGAKATVYLHGLDAGTKNFLYRLIWMPAIRRADNVIANSQATADLAISAGVNEAKIAIVHPGVEVPAHTADTSAGERFRAKYGLDRGKILLSVGRLTERKGLREFVQAVMPGIAAKHPDIILTVIGDTPTNSLFAKVQTHNSILEAARASGLEKNIRFLGVITDRSELAAAYRAADIHVFPVRTIAGDPEGFGMVAVEAASFGLATVAYATGGIVDAVEDGVSGYLVQPGDARGFAAKVLGLLDEPLDRELIHSHARQFAWEQFGSKIFRVIQDA